LNVAIVLIFALLGAVVALSFVHFAGTNSNNSSDALSLRSPHLCDTCHLNPENDGDYVLCESCGFDSSISKTLKCPAGFGDMLVVKAKEGMRENAQIGGKVYKHCKDTMVAGESSCSVNVLELIPDLYSKKFSDPDQSGSPRPPHSRPERPLPEPRGFGGMRGMDPFDGLDAFDPFMDFPLIFDILPFFDEEIVNEPPVGPNGEAVTNELNEHNEEAVAALIDAPEIDSMADLFEALPPMDENNPEHIKLTKTLMRCMQPGGTDIQKPLCLDGSKPLSCKKTPEHEMCQKKKQDKADNKAQGIKKRMGPICEDGSYAECDTENGWQGFKKPKKCYPNDGQGKPKKPKCESGLKAEKCTAGSTETLCQKGKKSFCPGSDLKPQCPTGYSKGPCQDPATGERSKAKCPEGSVKIKCKKDKNASDPICTAESGDRIWNTMCDNGEQPACQGNSEYALIPFLKKVQFSRPGDGEELMWDSSSAEEEEVFLSATQARGGRGGPRGGRGHKGRKPAFCTDGSKPGCYDDTGARNKEVVVCKDDTVSEGFTPFDPLDKCSRRLRRCSFDGTSMVKPTCADGSDIILPPRPELKCRDESTPACPAGSSLICKDGEEPTGTDFSSCQSKPICSDDETQEYVKALCDNGEQAVNLEKKSECGRGHFSAACYNFAEDGTPTFVSTGVCPKGFEEVKARHSVCSKGDAQLRTKLCEDDTEVICENGKPPKRRKHFLYPSWNKDKPTEEEAVTNLILSKGHGPREAPVGAGGPPRGPGRERPPFPPHDHHHHGHHQKEHLTIDFLCLKLNLN